MQAHGTPHADRRLGARLTRLERELRARRDETAAAVTAGRRLAPAAAWLLDNWTVVRASVREVREAVPDSYYRRLPRAADGAPRVFTLAAEMVQTTGASFEIETVEAILRNNPDTLTLAELWAVGPMLKLALLEALAHAPEDAGVAARVIGTLRHLESAPWRDFVESLSAVEAILRGDPAGVYARMDFETRDAYRHSVEGVARSAGIEETAAADLAIELARSANKHVGEFLSGPGFASFRKRAGCRISARGALHDLLYRYPNFFYLGALTLATAAIWAALQRFLAPVPWWVSAITLLPASQAALAVVNPLVNLLVPPRRLPRLDFSEGVPADCRTFVVVPTLLLSRAGLERLLENLEIHYLANRDSNMLFGLLTDFADAPGPTGPNDDLLDFAVEGITRLNARHATEEHAPFYLFHRSREWNPAEGVWMGPERKRGKLNDFNLYLLGEANHFSKVEGDVDAIGDVRYVLTLDSDTQLPRDTAGKLAATMAHPLNRPVFDERTGLVKRGYALMQPRISISMESAGRSHLARIFSGQTGFDPYTTAVSDVYQDLYGRASFTGKGIYDVRAFHRATAGRFPDNTLLSHDLIEGEHVRTALVTDLEFIDDYPSSYEAYSKRKHRWVRGDWQIAMWLLPRVPDAAWRRVRNPLPLVSRWKILDNLRRSLVEPALAALFLAACVLPGNSLRLAAAALGLAAFPGYAELAFALMRTPPVRLWPTWVCELAYRFMQAHAEALFHVVFLAHQACSMTDAVARTLIRRIATHRKLLEWESAAQAEAASGKGTSLMALYLYGSPLVALAAALAMHLAGAGATLTLVVLEFWIFAPLAARWVDRTLPRRRDVSAENRAFLRGLALETWRWFADFCRAEDNWLVPDNVQEDPPAEARTVSPTNLGLLLTANVAAHDFGYLTAQELAERTERTLRTMSRMERCHGHFYNWYDTRTLMPVLPHYVSSVDSGNLAASLILLKQGCLERLRRPIIDWSALEGLRDHAERLLDSLPAGERTGSLMRVGAALLRQVDYRPTDLFYFEGVVSEAGKLAQRLLEHASRAHARLAERKAPETAGVAYWMGALAARADTVSRDLCALAPWLAEPFETELRLASGDPTLGALLSQLSRVPAVSELPGRYDEVERLVRERLEEPDTLHPGVRRALEALPAALETARRRALRLIDHLQEQAAVAGGFIEEMDFKFLFDARRKLMHIGYDIGTGKLDEGYYDLLASEARTAVFIAIAKGDLPREAWFRLGRKLTAWRGKRALLSWSGTMFEYLMPAIFMHTWEGTLLGQSLRAVVDIQQIYAKERRVPWGISESAHSARDHALRYQYQAFGVPALGLKRGLGEELVLAPYAAALALMVDAPAAVANLQEMADRGWRGRYGMYEAVDYSPARGTVPAVIRAFMAHHQGMSLLSLVNVLLEAPMRGRFHAEPMVQATEYLLQERVPALMIVREEDAPAPLAVPIAREQAGEAEQAG